MRCIRRQNTYTTWLWGNFSPLLYHLRVKYDRLLYTDIARHTDFLFYLLT